VALLLTALACIVLGMEVPTTAAFVICISVAGPALARMGVPALDAHMFVFWYALLSTITPPVCGTVYIAALRGAGDTLVPGIATVVLAWTVIIGGGSLMRSAFPELASKGPWLAATAYIVLLGIFVTIRFERGGWKRIHLLDGRSDGA